MSCAPPDEPPPPDAAGGAAAGLARVAAAVRRRHGDRGVGGDRRVGGDARVGEAEPTWAAPFVPVAFWVCALAMPGHRATARIAAVAADALRNISSFSAPSRILERRSRPARRPCRTGRLRCARAGLAGSFGKREERRHRHPALGEPDQAAEPRRGEGDESEKREEGARRGGTAGGGGRRGGGAAGAGAGASTGATATSRPAWRWRSAGWAALTGAAAMRGWATNGRAAGAGTVMAAAGAGECRRPTRFGAAWAMAARATMPPCRWAWWRRCRGGSVAAAGRAGAAAVRATDARTAATAGSTWTASAGAGAVFAAASRTGATARGEGLTTGAATGAAARCARCRRRGHGDGLPAQEAAGLRGVRERACQDARQEEARQSADPPEGQERLARINIQRADSLICRTTNRPVRGRRKEARRRSAQPPLGVTR